MRVGGAGWALGVGVGAVTVADVGGTEAGRPGTPGRGFQEPPRATSACRAASPRTSHVLSPECARSSVCAMGCVPRPASLTGVG